MPQKVYLLQGRLSCGPMKSASFLAQAGLRCSSNTPIDHTCTTTVGSVLPARVMATSERTVTLTSCTHTQTHTHTYTHARKHTHIHTFSPTPTSPRTHRPTHTLLQSQPHHLHTYRNQTLASLSLTLTITITPPKSNWALTSYHNTRIAAASVTVKLDLTLLYSLLLPRGSNARRLTSGGLLSI